MLIKISSWKERKDDQTSLASLNVTLPQLHVSKHTVTKVLGEKARKPWFILLFSILSDSRRCKVPRRWWEVAWVGDACRATFLGFRPGLGFVVMLLSQPFMLL